MTSRADADEAVQVLHGQHIDTRYVEVSLISEQQSAAADGGVPSAIAAGSPAATPTQTATTTRTTLIQTPNSVSPVGGAGAGDTGGSGGSNGAEAMVNAAAQALLAARKLKQQGVGGPAGPMGLGDYDNSWLTKSNMAAAAAAAAAASQGGSRPAAALAPSADLAAVAATMLEIGRPSAGATAGLGASGTAGLDIGGGISGGTAGAGVADDSQWQAYFNFLKRGLEENSGAGPAAGLPSLGATSPAGLSGLSAPAGLSSTSNAAMSNSALMSAIASGQLSGLGLDMQGGAWPGGLQEGQRTFFSQGLQPPSGGMVTSGLSIVSDNPTSFSSLPAPATAGGPPGKGSSSALAGRSVLSLSSSLTGSMGQPSPSQTPNL